MSRLEYNYTLKIYQSIFDFYLQFLDGLSDALPLDDGLLVQPDNKHKPAALYIFGTKFEITIRPIQKDCIYGLVEFRHVKNDEVIFTSYIDRQGNFGSDKTENGVIKLFSSVNVPHPDYKFYVIRPLLESFFLQNGLTIK
jgi:hypothetical protein